MHIVEKTEMKKLIDRPGLSVIPKTSNRYHQLILLLSILEKRELPNQIVEFVNTHVDELNALSESDKYFGKKIKNAENKIITHIEKQVKVVPKKYYQKFWQTMGMTAFGLPVGVAISSAAGNSGLIGVGLPIGMVIGMAIGLNKDKKACNEGRQLDYEQKP